jgi:hypothetical protein
MMTGTMPCLLGFPLQVTMVNKKTPTWQWMGCTVISVNIILSLFIIMFILRDLLHDGFRTSPMVASEFAWGANCCGSQRSHSKNGSVLIKSSYQTFSSLIFSSCKCLQIIYRLLDETCLHFPGNEFTQFLDSRCGILPTKLHHNGLHRFCHLPAARFWSIPYHSTTGTLGIRRQEGGNHIILLVVLRSYHLRRR